MFFNLKPITERKGFTLIELLIVVGIVGALATVTVLVINPAELFKSSRDSRRMHDLHLINKAISAISLDNLPLGDLATVYVSIPDTASNCSNLGLPALPAGWGYYCVTTANYRKTDGTGWIPINLSQAAIGSPLSALPIDPINTTSSGFYYTYQTDGRKWEITAVPESQKSKSQLQANPQIPNYPYAFAQGSDLGLSPIYTSSGLVGWWRFDETSGTTASDSSGNGNLGTMYSGATPTDFHSGSGCKVGEGCANFNGSTYFVDVGNGSTLNFGTGNFSISVWAKYTSTGLGQIGLVGKRNNDNNGETGFDTFLRPNNSFSYTRIKDLNHVINDQIQGSGAMSVDTGWHFYAWVFDRTSNVYLYKDGTQIGSANIVSHPASINTSYSMKIGKVQGFFSGLMDDVKVYNRTISAAEIRALYDSQK